MYDAFNALGMYLGRSHAMRRLIRLRQIVEDAPQRVTIEG